MFNEIKKRIKPMLASVGLLSAAQVAARKLAFLNPVLRERAAKARAFYGRFISPGDLCFDVGANIGDRTQTFLDLGARIVCVDPQPRCIQQLRLRFRGCDRVTVVERGLGEKDGYAELAIGDNSTVATMSDQWRSKGRFSSSSQWNTIQRVQVTTLDALIEAHGMPAFCKIDVEGFEFQVLRGLTRGIPQVSFEFTREFTSEAENCMRRLSSLGPYLFNYSLGESMELLQDQWLGGGELAAVLASLKDSDAWGDVYAALPDKGSRAKLCESPSMGTGKS